MRSYRQVARRMWEFYKKQKKNRPTTHTYIHTFEVIYTQNGVNGRRHHTFNIQKHRLRYNKSNKNKGKTS